MIKIDIKQVVDLHIELIKEFGGLPGIQNKRLLESVIMLSQQGYYDNDIEITGAIIYSLCMNHAFNVGNKRVAAVETYNNE